jgi:tetratricopeptide (TPR) repeat protein
LQSEDIATLLPDARADAARVLEKARLVEIRNKRLTMLAPLRETAREEKLAMQEDEGRLIEYFLAIAADGSKIGRDAWPTVRNRVTREVGNLDAVCLLALDQLDTRAKSPKQIGDALLGLGKLNAYGLPVEVTSLQRARTLSQTEALFHLKANVLHSLGNIALARSDHDTARAHFEEARPLFERAGSLLGQANCIYSLGEIALRRSDHDTARARFEEAKPLFERVGDVLGQANCIYRLGEIALRRSDHDTARARFEEAKPLFERVGDVLGPAACIYGIGEIAFLRSEHDAARARYEEALGLYARIPEPYSAGLTHLALMQTAADDADRDRHQEAARAAWASIGRQDLIAKHLDAS